MKPSSSSSSKGRKTLASASDLSLNPALPLASTSAAARELLSALAKASPLSMVPLVPRLAHLIHISAGGDGGKSADMKADMKTRALPLAGKGKKGASDFDVMDLRICGGQGDGSGGRDDSALVISEPLDREGAELAVQLLARASPHCNTRSVLMDVRCEGRSTVTFV